VASWPTGVLSLAFNCIPVEEQASDVLHEDFLIRCTRLQGWVWRTVLL
jgi:hypothetical protein